MLFERLAHRIYVFGLSRGFWGVWGKDLVLRFLLSRAEQGMYVLDIGSNRGTYSSALRRKVGPGGGVYAFEPNTEILRKYSYAYRNINVLPIGLSDESGIREFFVHTREASPTSSLREIPELAAAQELRKTVIYTTTIDSIFLTRNYSEFNFGIVKIDVEGSELQVLLGMSKFIQKFQPIIVFEFIYRLNTEVTYNAFCSIFRNYGYKMNILESGVDFYQLNFVSNPYDLDIRKSTNINVICIPGVAS